MNLRQLITLGLKAAICIAAIAWVARGVAVEELIAVWLEANKPLLACALLLFLLTPLLQAVRLRRLLAAQDIRIGMGESVRLAFAGNFMNFAAPIGSTTGDVFKAIYLGRRTKRSWEAAATTFADRGIGLGTLLLCVTLIALLSRTDSALALLRGYLTVLSLVLVAGVGLVLWLPMRTNPWISRWIERLPKRDVLLRAGRATRMLLASPRVLTLAVVDTLGIQIAAAASFLCVALALGFRIAPDDWVAVYAFFSAGEIVKALPGPPQGLGTMEVAYSFFFSHWAGASQIVSAAIAIRLVNLICSLPGALFATGWMTTAKARRASSDSASTASSWPATAATRIG
jgi:uncharacterized protein (TIRG00374 family)